MTCTLKRVNETDLRRLREAPEQVFTFLFGDLPPLETVREPGVGGFIMRLLGFTTQQVSATAAADESAQIEDGEAIDIDKAWNGLHFLFTGTAEGGEEPASFLLCGGEEIGNEDVGPARVLRPDQVSQFAAFLAELSDEELRRRYDPTRMTALDVYPDIWTRGPGEAAFDYLLDAFNELRDFVSATSARGDSMIVSIV
ncbi:MAG TPA: YfbM family protein [Pyrinomonadaceae bacterium]|nr:YfbM family protein [Pyrinomonadaceae bacterium]